MCLSLAKHRVRRKCQNSTLLHTRTDSHFFSPPKCRPDGGRKGRLQVRQIKREITFSRLIAEKLYQYCSHPPHAGLPYGLLSARYRVLRTQLKVGIFPTECPILALQLGFL